MYSELFFNYTYDLERNIILEESVTVISMGAITISALGDVSINIIEYVFLIFQYMLHK